MQCKDCNYNWLNEGDDFPRCHWEERCPGDKAPCEYEDEDVSPIEELLLEDAIKLSRNMVEISVKEGNKNMYDLKEIIKEKIKDVARYIDIDDMIAELVDDCITSSMVEHALKEKLRDYVGDVADDLMDEALDEYIDEELE